MASNKRKVSDRDDVTEDKISKSAKLDHCQNMVTVVTYKLDDDGHYHVPYVYYFPQDLFDDYKPLMDDLVTRRDSYRPIQDSIYEKIKHLESVVHYYAKSDCDDYVTYNDIWNHAIRYWLNKEKIKSFLDDDPILNVNIVKTVVVLDM